MNKYWYYFILIVTVIAITIGFQKCWENKYNSPAVVVSKTTSKKSYDPPIHINRTSDNPMQIGHEEKPIPKSMARPLNYDSLAKKYDSLLIAYYAINTFLDSVVVDSSIIKVKSYVKENRLLRNDYSFDIRPIRITTDHKIIQTLPARRQLYFNYGVGGGYMPATNIWTADVIAGFSYKDRKDRITTFNGAASTNGQLRGEIIMSTKLSFRRNRP